MGKEERRIREVIQKAERLDRSNQERIQRQVQAINRLLQMNQVGIAALNKIAHEAEGPIAALAESAIAAIERLAGEESDEQNPAETGAISNG